MTNIPDDSRPLQVALVLGTGQPGCTALIARRLQDALASRFACAFNTIALPGQAPPYCIGCKRCFKEGMPACPHADIMLPHWEALCSADLIAFVLPTYVWRAPAQVKALLDHLGTRWMVHAPDPRMYRKRALIITQAVGAGMRGSARDVSTSLRFWGIPRIKKLCFRVMHTETESIPAGTLRRIDASLARFAQELAGRDVRPAPSLFARLMFHVMRIGHRGISKQEVKHGRPRTYDDRYWQQQGWYADKRPWQDA